MRRSRRSIAEPRFEPAVDEFEALGVEREASSMVKPPRIKETNSPAVQGFATPVTRRI